MRLIYFSQETGGRRPSQRVVFGILSLDPGSLRGDVGGHPVHFCSCRYSLSQVNSNFKTETKSGALKKTCEEAVGREKKKTNSALRC